MKNVVKLAIFLVISGAFSLASFAVVSGIEVQGKLGNMDSDQVEVLTANKGSLWVARSAIPHADTLRAGQAIKLTLNTTQFSDAIARSKQHHALSKQANGDSK